MWWFALLALLALVVAYVFARPRLLRIPAWAAFCAWIDPLVISWLSRSRQIAVSRLTGLAGFAVALSNSLSDAPIDWSMAGDLITGFLPEAWQPVARTMLVPMLIWAGGEMFRRVTKEPLAAKE